MGRRIARTVAVAVLGAAAVSACAPSDLGAAAVVDNTRITVSEIQGSLAAVRALQDRYGLVNEDPGSAARARLRALPRLEYMSPHWAKSHARSRRSRRCGLRR